MGCCHVGGSISPRPARPGVPLVPVTISGARTLFPTRGFPALGFGEITVTVHDPIPTAGREVDELMREAHDAIALALRPCDMLPPSKVAAEPQAAGLKQE